MSAAAAVNHGRIGCTTARKREGLASSVTAIGSFLGLRVSACNPWFLVRHVSPIYSACFKAAAAAAGPTTRLASDSAQRIVKGVPKGTGPTIAAFDAATPKMRTGIVSGKISTGTSNPPRRSAAASAAPISPRKVRAGVPARSVSATAAIDHKSMLKKTPNSGAAMTKRQSGSKPMRERFGEDCQCQRRASHQDQIERAVLAVVGEKLVQRQQAGEQGAEPQNCRSDAPQQCIVGTDREGNERDDDQKKQHAHPGAAAHADRQAQVADEKGEERAHASDLAV